MAIPFLNHITLNQNEARDLRLHQVEDQDVQSPVSGQIIFDNGTNENVIKYYDGSAWITLGGDTDNYVDSASLSGTTLTLGRTGSLSDLTVNLSSLAYDNYVDSASLSGTTLTIGRTGVLADLTVNLSSLQDGNDYVDGASLSGNTLTLTRTGSLADLTVDLSSLDTDDNYVDTASLSGTTLTLGRTGSLADLTVDLSSLDETVNDNDIAIQGGTYLSLSSGQDGIFTLNQSSDETITLNHNTTSRSNTTSTGSPSAGATFTAIDSITTNSTGHVTAVNTKTVTLPGDNNTDTLQSIAADTSNADRFITSVASASGAQTGLSHSTLKYNPSTETLKVTNLIISGTSTTVNTEEINLADNIIKLNSNYSGSSPSENAGIEVERGTLDNVKLNWDESDDDWEFTAYNHAATPALTTYKIPRTFKGYTGGTAPWVVDHNLGTRDVIVQLYDTSSYETVYADVVRTTANRITLTFASAPAAGDVTVLVSTVNA